MCSINPRRPPRGMFLRWLRRSSVVRAVGAAGVALTSLSAIAQVSYLEKVPPGENEDIKEIVQRVIDALSRHYPKEQVLVRRDAHAKAHGCVKASFQVDNDIPDDLRVGIFKTPGRSYRAWIRFSNGAFEPSPDPRMDGRGMAIKLLDVSQSIDQLGGKFRTQDMLMINYPVFFSPDANDYKAFSEAGALTGDSAGLRRYFFPSYNPFKWRIRQAWIAYKIASQTVMSPLSAQYYSMVPYRFGFNESGLERAVKYSAKPCDRQGGNNLGASDATGPDYLREAMVAELNEKSVCYSFFVQEKQAEMSIEDATADWDESKSPWKKIATIMIPKQTFDTPERKGMCESMSFNPYNTTTEHIGLGGINRIRAQLYGVISDYRHRRNRVENVDPSKAWDESK